MQKWWVKRRGILKCDFGLSENDWSDEEEGEDLHGCLDKPEVPRKKC